MSDLRRSGAGHAARRVRAADTWTMLLSRNGELAAIPPGMRILAAFA
ncbi:hypothetical protein [Streptomyces caeruleatus]|nr:hypothetical protein [Streptomyces caeruleatus]